MKRTMWPLPLKCRAIASIWCQSRFGCGVDAGQHVGYRKVGIVHAPEDRISQRIERYRDAAQARGTQRARLAREYRTVGGERQIKRRAIRGPDLRQHFDQGLEILAQQRLAAREPNLLHPMRDKNPRQASDFLEREQVALRQERIVAIEYIFRHAIGAAKVAAICDRNAQVAQRPAATISDQSARRLELATMEQGRRAHTFVAQKDDAVSHCPSMLPARNLSTVSNAPNDRGALLWFVASPRLAMPNAASRPEPAADRRAVVAWGARE